MGLKRGYMVEETTPIVSNARIHRVRLHSGENVYLPADLFRGLIERHSPAAEFFFVERGLLGRTAWAGTLTELRDAVASGVVEAGELGNLPAELFRTSQEWASVDPRYNHSKGGSTLETYREVFKKRGRMEQARALTRDAWIATGHRDGCCMQMHEEADHGSVWCTLDAGHPGPHEPECPECWLVQMLMERVADVSNKS